MKYQNYFAISTLLILILLATYCSSPPSEEIMQTAIKEAYQESLNSFKFSKSKAEVEWIKILQVGDYNGEQEYWPVKATVRVKNVVFNKDMSSEKTYDYRIFKDEYDNWKASQKGFMDELGKSLGL